jgi:hypothetical protein
MVARWPLAFVLRLLVYDLLEICDSVRLYLALPFVYLMGTSSWRVGFWLSCLGYWFMICWRSATQFAYISHYHSFIWWALHGGALASGFRAKVIGL